MKTEGCRDWRHLLGAYALGDLSAEERAGLEAHLEGCPSAGPRPSRWTRGAAAAARRPGSLQPAGAAALARPRPSGSRRRSAASSGSSGAGGAGVRPRPERGRGRRGGGDPGDRHPPRRRRRPARAARRVRLAAGRDQDLRHARAPRLRHRDPHVREGGPLRHPLPRLPARAARRTGSRRHLHLPLGRRLDGGAELGARPLPHPRDRRPRRQPNFCRPGGCDRGDGNGTTRTRRT